MDELDFLLAEQRRLVESKSSVSLTAAEVTLLKGLNPVQRDFVLDEHRRIAALVARRGGKTTAGRARLVRRSLRTPNGQCVYMAIGRPHAEELMWMPLKELMDRLEVQASFNETRLRMTLKRNGAVLQLVGADDRSEIEKLRGRKFHEVGIDEAASYNPKLLEDIIHAIVGPGLTDYRGTLWQIGTPGRWQMGPFFEGTRPGSKTGMRWRDLEPGSMKWSVHQWGQKDNVALPHLWEEALLTMEANGWTVDTPAAKREFFGLWAIDDTGYVYKFRKYTPDGSPWNVWKRGKRTGPNPFGLPAGHEWLYVIGMDLGFKDPFALQVLGYAETCRDCYQAFEFNKKGMTVREVSDLLNALIDVIGYPVGGITADTAGLGEMVLSELKETYGLVVEPAKKKDKNDAIELLNSDLVDGRFKVLEGSQLEMEMTTLQWDEKDPTKEATGVPNNNCDAVLYARRKALHHFSHDPLPKAPKPGSLEAIELSLKKQEEEASRERTPEDRWFESNDDFSFLDGGGFDS